MHFGEGEYSEEELEAFLSDAFKANEPKSRAAYLLDKVEIETPIAANDPSYPQFVIILRKRHFGLAIALTWLLLSSKWNVSTSVKIEISAKYEVTLNQADFPLLPSTAGLIPLPVPNQAEFQVPCRFTLAKEIT